MKKENLSDFEMHSAGAIVRHKSPFEELASYVNVSAITQEFRKQWVIPFYFEFNNYSDDWVQKMIDLKPKITEKVILQNLGDFDWRTRSTGSYFAAIMEARNTEDIIGTHLLKSEVCFAGVQYAITLAAFNSKKSANYLNRYLEYYLTKPELYFDQSNVLQVLKYLDEINGTNHLSKHLSSFKMFLELQQELTINTLENIKKIMPEKLGEMEQEIQKMKQIDMTINTAGIYQAVETINRIAEG